MCGIVGYIGPRDTTSFLLEGLRRLEYRGYDSAGVALIGREGLQIRKTAGRIEALATEVANDPVSGTIGIGHTRWATHGEATVVNAHPHSAAESEVTLVHNGVIENYQALKTRLESKGYKFVSATDSEVLVQLISYELSQLKPSETEPYQHLIDAVTNAVDQVRGTYGIAVLFRDYPDVMIASRLGSPLVIGVGEQEHFVASDASPLVGFTDRIVYLADHQLAVVTADRLEISHRQSGQVHLNVEKMPEGSVDVGLNGFDHYMLQEIYEQPTSVQNAMRGRLSDEHASAVFGGLNLTPRQLRGINRIVLTACGTSWHAAMVGEYLIEELAGIPVEVEYASELRYRNPPMDSDTLLFAITQSGETADTLAALREMKRKGHHTLAICNVVGSSIAQEADGGIYLHAGPEIGVASTKAYTSQCTVLAMLALYFGRLRNMSFDQGREAIAALRQLPSQVEKTLECAEQVKAIAEKYYQCDNFLYMGRQYHFPTALEGALKLKEISYIHAEGYPAAEMKHGPIALVDKTCPSVFIMPQGKVYEKVMANLEEVKARGGPVIAVVADEDTDAKRIADDVIYIPHVPEFLQPITSVLPLQLLAYHVALLRGCDVDKPRNLAKSVTVE